MSETLHEVRFPNEPAGYREARDELLRAEMDLRERMEAVAALRRKLPIGGVVKEDYVFDELLPDSKQAKQTKLSELFASGKDSLILYSFMYGPEMEKPCPACTSLLDGMDRYARHVTQRVNLAVVAKSPIERVQAFAKERDWERLRLLSSHNNSYHSDYVSESPEGSQWPMCHVFVKRAEGIHHFWGSELFYAPSEGHPRHVDLLWPIWSYFDLTPEGRGTDWFPQLSYE